MQQSKNRLTSSVDSLSRSSNAWKKKLQKPPKWLVLKEVKFADKLALYY